MIDIHMVPSEDTLIWLHAEEKMARRPQGPPKNKPHASKRPLTEKGNTRMCLAIMPSPSSVHHSWASLANALPQHTGKAMLLFFRPDGPERMKVHLLYQTTCRMEGAPRRCT